MNLLTVPLHPKLLAKETYYRSRFFIKTSNYIVKDDLSLYNYPYYVPTTERVAFSKKAYDLAGFKPINFNFDPTTYIHCFDTVFGRFECCDFGFESDFNTFIDCVCYNDYNGGRRYNFDILINQPSDIDIYLFLSKMKWHNIKKNSLWCLPYRFREFFLRVDCLSPACIIQLLLIMSGLETNPGPVMSKFAKFDCSRDFRATVKTQGITDIFNSSLLDVNKFTKDFSTFVGKIPDRLFLENSITDISGNCARLVELVGTTFTQLETQVDQTCANMNFSMQEARKLVIGIIAVLLMYFVVRQCGFLMGLGAVLFGFVIHYFGVFENLKDLVLDNGKKFWDYLGATRKDNVQVNVEGVADNICHSLLDPASTNLFSAIFASTCVYAVGQAPGTKDFADLSRKLFDYNKGATALESIFEKAKNFWTYMVEFIAFKMGIKESGGRITRYSLYISLNDWFNRCTELFKGGFGDIPDKDGKEISFDERKLKRRALMALYNEGLDYSRRTNLLNKETQLMVTTWNSKINEKVKAMSTEALNGEMRNPPTVMLLYGRSGVGKTSMVDGIKALASAVISDVEGLDRASSANVYVRNSDMLHWDGYHAQQFVLFDDLGCRKDNETNPNLELKELIGAKNSQPYPVPMAHLEEKGKFFTSQFIFCTTNIENMSSYIKSMTFPEAIVSRLSELSYICRVKPQYRKPMSAEDLLFFKERQIHDQHYVDVRRTQYDISDKEVKEKFGLDWSFKHVNSFLTQEQFDSIRPCDVRRCGNGKPQRINYGIYYFEPLNMRTGKPCGDPIEWPELCERVEAVIRERLEIGSDLLGQQKDLHVSTLEDIKAGKITVRTQGKEEEFSPSTSHVLGSDRAKDLKYCVDNNLFDLQTVVVRDLIKQYGPGFHSDLLLEHFNIFSKQDSGLETEESDEDVVIVALNERWSKIFKKTQEYYNRITNVINNKPVMKSLKIGAGILAYCAVFYLIVKTCRKFENWAAPDMVKARETVEKEIAEQTKHLPWWRRLFSTLGSPFNPLKIKAGSNTLDENQIFDLYKMYNIRVMVEGAEGSWDPKANGRTRSNTPVLRASVATMGFNVDNIKTELERDFKNITVENTESGADIIFGEHLIHHVLVTVQSNQLTTDAISHVLPANVYMMDYQGIDGAKRTIGNVTFLHDRALLMPFHYVQRLEHDVNHRKTLNDDCIFTFSRAPTHLELGKNSPANKMKCTYKNILNYRRIEAPVFLDDTASMAKDAVIVHLSGSGISGHNCSNIIKKFIKREDLSKLCSSGLSGYMVVQRNIGLKNNICTDVKERVVLGCSAITPVNVMRRTANGWFNNDIYDFDGTQYLKDKDGKEMTYKVTLRDRYEYTAGAMSGDCGAILWVDHPQLTHCIVGMHSTAHPLEGKGCSVPITQEDIEETLVKLGQCAVNCFEEPELSSLSETDVFGIPQLVPQGNFQYIGKMEKDYPMQPIKTCIISSPAQENLHILKNEYKKRTGRNYELNINKAPAIMRVQYQNPEGYSLFEDKGKVWFRKEGECARVCSLGDYNIWLSKGGIRRDPLHEGLAKNSQDLPLIKSSLIDDAVQSVSQKLLKTYNPLCVDPFSKAMAQNDFYLNENIKEKIQDIKKRNYLIRDCILEEFPKIKKFDIKIASERLIRTISLDKRELLVLKNANNLKYSGVTGMDLLLIDFANHSRYMETQTLNTNDPNPMILTIEQSVSGIDGDGTIRSINAKKSPGFPWSKLRKPFGKRYWVGKEVKCDGPGWEELKLSVEKLINEAKHKIPEVYFIDTMKDELRSLEKIKNFKTRIFSAGPMHFSIAFRMYFMRFLSFIMENKIDNESAIGINPYSTEWEKLAKHLNVWDGPTCIAGDYSNFDGSLSNQIMEKLLDVVEDFYAEYGSTVEERNIRRNLWTCLTRSLHIGRDGGVYRWYNSQPSGNPYTTLINIMFNMVVFRIVYSLIFGKATNQELGEIFPDGFPFKGPPPKLTLGSFESNVKFIAYGDDNCANINPDILDWLNMHTISRAMKLLGLTYTDEFKNKDGDVAKARFLTDINFLKRGFKQIDFQGRKWIAPLDIDTVKEIPMWVRTSDSVRRDQVMIDNVKGTCMEMCLHGEQAYEDWIIFISGMRHKDLLGKHFPPIENYYEQFEMTCNEVLDF